METQNPNSINYFKSVIKTTEEEGEYKENSGIEMKGPFWIKLTKKKLKIGNNQFNIKILSFQSNWRDAIIITAAVGSKLNGNRIWFQWVAKLNLKTKQGIAS